MWNVNQFSKKMYCSFWEINIKKHNCLTTVYHTPVTPSAEHNMLKREFLHSYS